VKPRLDVAARTRRLASHAFLVPVELLRSDEFFDLVEVRPREASLW
jgi:hypothetical protein